MNHLLVGVLAFQGSVAEHKEATEKAARNMQVSVSVRDVRTVESLKNLDALIIPGGESTTLFKLCHEARMVHAMKKVRSIFGTCAGAIMLSKKVRHSAASQKTLELMDIETDRNAYGRQIHSFVKGLQTNLGEIEAVFIRAPKIVGVEPGVKILARDVNEIYACEQSKGKKYYLAASFHPEFTSTAFHEYFLKQVLNSAPPPA